MGPLPQKIGTNSWPLLMLLAVCVVQCTSCAEGEVVLVACTTDAAPILKEWVYMYMYGGAYDVGSCIMLVYILMGEGAVVSVGGKDS